MGKGIRSLMVAHVLVPVTCLTRTPDLWVYLLSTRDCKLREFQMPKYAARTETLWSAKTTQYEKWVVQEQISRKEEALLKLFYSRKAGGLMWKSMAGRSFSLYFCQPLCRISIARRCRTYLCWGKENNPQSVGEKYSPFSTVLSSVWMAALCVLSAEENLERK